MKKYKANRKGILIYIVVIITILPIAIFLMDTDTFVAKPFILLPLLAPLLLILWIYFDTSYKIENEHLIYRSGFLRGKINIENIKEIVKGKTSYSGKKPAFARKGLIIRYNKFDEIYISPESNDEIINDLLKLRPEIKIINNR